VIDKSVDTPCSNHPRSFNHLSINGTRSRNSPFSSTTSKRRFRKAMKLYFNQSEQNNNLLDLFNFIDYSELPGINSNLNILVIKQENV